MVWDLGVWAGGRVVAPRMGGEERGCRGVVGFVLRPLIGTEAHRILVQPGPGVAESGHTVSLTSPFTLHLKLSVIAHAARPGWLVWVDGLVGTECVRRG